MPAGPASGRNGHGQAKVLLVGLDGASWRIIDPLLAEGRLPHLNSILERGGRAVLNSTMPPLTPPAWATLMTGMNPGKHGVLTFRALDFTRYSSFVERLATSTSFSDLSIFRLLSETGARVASVGMPMTFPPFEVNGVLISGTPKLAIEPSSTFPSSLAGELEEFREKPPRLGRKDEFRAYMARYLAAFSNAANQMLGREHWDLFSVVYSNTDWVVHQFWEYYDETFPTYSEEGARQYGDAIPYEYEQADRALGELLTATGNETLVIVMSDHGAGANGYRAVALNFWLEQNGLLVKTGEGEKSGSGRAALLEKVRLLTPTPILSLARAYMPERLKAAISAGRLNIAGVSFGQTKAYRVPLMPMYDAVVVNLRGRQPEGIVDPADAAALRARLKATLPSITDPDTGEPVIAAAWTRDELFAGPYLEDMPDVVVEYAEGYTGGADLTAPLVRPVDEFFLRRDSGFHRQDGILAAAGPSVDPAGFPAVADIADVAPTVLAALGHSVPAEMDGRPINAIIGDRWTLAEGDGNDLERRQESLEDEEIRKSLEALGYF
jgi:predicted AlkP superfamily phosphohydrolase/phosphomutase